MPTTQTIRAQILDALFAALSNMTGKEGVSFYRNKTDAMGKGKMPAVVMQHGGQRKSVQHTHEDRYTMNVTVEIYVQEKDDAAMTAKAEEIYGYVTAFIATLNVASPLMGLAEDVVESELVDPSQADSDANLVVNLEVTYVTKSNDPFNLPA